MINEMVTELAKARHAADEAAAHLREINERIDSEYGDARRAASAILNKKNTKVLVLEANLRTLAVSEFQHTGSKKPHKALSVGEYETLEYDDEAAIAYCMKHEISAALKLDKRRFNGVAKALRPDFVEFGVEPRGKIGRDLEEWR